MYMYMYVVTYMYMYVHPVLSRSGVVISVCLYVTISYRNWGLGDVQGRDRSVSP